MSFKWTFVILATELLICVTGTKGKGKWIMETEKESPGKWEGKHDWDEGKSWSWKNKGGKTWEDGKSWESEAEPESKTWKEKSWDPEAEPEPKSWSGKKWEKYKQKTIYQNPGSTLPFSAAVQVGNTLYVSGNIGVVPGSSPPALAEGGLEAQAKQTLDNIGRTLKAAGTGFANVVKATVFLKTMKDYGKMNEVYRKYFHGNFPARAITESPNLALGALVEIEVIAHVDPLTVKVVDITSKEEPIFEEAHFKHKI